MDLVSSGNGIARVRGQEREFINGRLGYPTKHISTDSLSDVTQALLADELAEGLIDQSYSLDQYISARTFEHRALFDKEQLDDISNDIAESGNTELIMNMWEWGDLEPIIGLRIGQLDFAFSDVFTTSQGSRRPYAVGYVREHGAKQVFPRLFYQSRCDGGWRATPGFYAHNGGISKGRFGSEEFGQYVQATKPVEDIAAILDALERQAGGKHVGRRAIHKMFELDQAEHSHDRVYEDEVRMH